MYIKNAIKNKFIKFIFVGILNTIVGYALFALFIFMHLHYSLAVLLSTILGVLFNFSTIGRIVFNSTDRSLIFRFIAVYIVIYILNIFGLWIFDTNGFNDMYINGFILIMPLALVSFVFNKTYVFKG